MTGSIKRISVDIPLWQHRLVRVRAAEDGISISDAVRRLLEPWLRSEVRLSTQPPEEAPIAALETREVVGQ